MWCHKTPRSRHGTKAFRCASIWPCPKTTASEYNAQGTSRAAHRNWKAAWGRQGRWRCCEAKRKGDLEMHSNAWQRDHPHARIVKIAKAEISRRRLQQGSTRHEAIVPAALRGEDHIRGWLEDAEIEAGALSAKRIVVLAGTIVTPAAFETGTGKHSLASSACLRRRD